MESAPLGNAMFAIPTAIRAPTSTLFPPTVGLLPNSLQLIASTPQQTSTLDIQQLGMTTALPQPVESSLSDASCDVSVALASDMSIESLMKNNNSPQLLNLMLNQDVGQHPATIPEEAEPPATTTEQTDLTSVIVPQQEAPVSIPKALTIIQTASQLQTLLQSLTQSTHAEQQQQLPQQLSQQQLPQQLQISQQQQLQPQILPRPTALVAAQSSQLMTALTDQPTLRGGNVIRNASLGSELRPSLWSETDLPLLSGARTLLPSTEIRRASTGSVASLAGSPAKRNGIFLVPQVPVLLLSLSVSHSPCRLYTSHYNVCFVFAVLVTCPALFAWQPVVHPQSIVSHHLSMLFSVYW